MSLADRLLTIAITATLTSAAWIVVGGSLLRTANDAPAIPATPSATPARPAAVGTARAGPAEPGGLLIPVAGVAADQLTDTYADSRGDGDHVHDAIDIMAPRGTRVVAAAPGTIERLFHSQAGGTAIYLRTEDRRRIHYYAHLDRYAPGLREGQKVAQGEFLGEVGSTGNASESAPHLHFAILRTAPDAEWWEPATAINPYPLLQGR